MVVCKNCGGEYDDSLSKCPYCGSMHKAGAYRKFRQKISNIIDQMLGLKKEVEESTGKIILVSLFRGILLCLLVSGIAFGLAMFTNTNYYNDKTYDEKLLKRIEWQNENVAKLDAAYEANDLDTIEELYNENSEAVHKWKHYSSYYLRKQYNRILSKMDTFDEYVLFDCIYYVCYPEYYVNFRTMSDEELVDYENMKADVLNHLVEKGYSESEIQTIYEHNKDDYGYLRYDEIRKYLRGEDDG